MGTKRARTQFRSWGVALVVSLLALAVGAAAQAGVSKKVEKKFRGQIIITDEPLPEVGEGKEAVGIIKKLDKSSIKGDDVEGVMSWTFYYTAFLKKPPKTTDLTLDFHTADKENLYVANKRLQVNGNLTIIEGRITITEDDGPSRNRTYHLILRAKKGSKEIEVAKTKLNLK